MSETLKRAAELLRQYGWMANTVKAYQGDETLQVAADLERMAQTKPVAWRVHPFDYGAGCEGAYALTMRVDQVSAWGRKGWGVDPLYLATRLPRDVLMAVAREVRSKQIQIVREGLQTGRWIADIDDSVSRLDIGAIVDRHAAKAEPVNKQMLSVLKRIVDTCNSADFDGEPSAAEMKAAEEAIAAAESAQAQQPADLVVCNWHQEDDDCSWNSSCGVHFMLNDGTPSENGMKFCHKCGKTLAEHPWQDDGEPDDDAHVAARDAQEGGAA